MTPYSDHDSKTGVSSDEPPHYGADVLSFDNVPPSSIVPLKDLARWPRAVECRACGKTSITRTEHKICGGTHAMAALFLFCTVLGGPLPYFSKTFKDVEHYCCRCACKLATFHFPTGTEVHVF